MSARYVTWRGNRVHVCEDGHGDPLVLATGLGGTADMWAPFMGWFPTRRIIRFDAPGTGQSSTPAYPVPVAALAELTAAVLDATKTPCADVIGFSYGGAVAQQFAYEYPQRVRRLVLAATSCGVGSVLGSFAATSALLTPLRYYSATYFERTAGHLFGGETARNAAARHLMLVTRQRHPPSPYGYAMQLLGAFGWSSWHFLHLIPHETLVISGDDDPLIPVVNAEMLARRIPRARLEIVKGAGHLFLWDDVENQAERIAQFIDPFDCSDTTTQDNIVMQLAARAVATAAPLT